MEFEEEYERWMKSHWRRRKGPARERLKFEHGTGHGHAEKLFLQHVWWPAFQQFHNLHPEYEIRDFKDGYRYIDFAYIRPYFRIAIEIDGIGSHWRNLTQWQFSDHLQRQNHLIIDGWRVLRFTYADIQERPRHCQQILEQLRGRLAGTVVELQAVSFINREIIRLAMQSNQPLKPAQVASAANITPRAAINHLQYLVATSWLEPASGSQRIRSYRLHPSRSDATL